MFSCRTQSNGSIRYENNIIKNPSIDVEYMTKVPTNIPMNKLMNALIAASMAATEVITMEINTIGSSSAILTMLLSLVYTGLLG